MPFCAALNPAPAVLGSGSDFAGSGASLACSDGSLWEGGKRAQPAPTLPCQSSNNSTEQPSRLTPYQRKNAFSINENLGFVIERHGLEKIGFLTLTFPKNLTLKEANRRFNSLASHFLDLHFESWVCVREFTKGGRPHFHLVVVCREDIRTGFDFEKYVEMSWMSSSPRRRHRFAHEIKKLSRSLNPSPALRSIWRELHRVLPLYQFGRHELIPIRKNGAALARYVGGYIRKSMDFRPVEAKGARLISYSKNFPRKVVGHAWAFNTEGSKLWRKKVEMFAGLHRVRDLDQMKARFGPRWAWWFRDLIASLNLLPTLKGDQIRAYLEGVDLQRFNDALEAGTRLDAMHLYRPELPEIDGNKLPPPRRLRRVFDYHLSNWNKSAEQISQESEAARRRFAGVQKFFTDEMLAAARARILAAPKLTPAAVRSRNYMMTCHPRHFAENYATA